ncbi:hypothetical protein LTR10_017452 [Elasticomyces elasticus]|uniref:NmrA-like domain-containing protein n=1 Tax=Exophiala sideris TaxID=1016849 RepID=A0ABR0JAF8_9EURO|nr:hypothetical protein LTR10_017452 [Elasticomyces elasticus]KAK5030366.1 hypothetical protein LTS07_005150 [Exophiala sideris]KAK5038419.1 hypothetical protein LTR13_004166 [Exophiala sideris]KAK5060302.1 hypothetical protein LTR69_005619 [Exophiala sideris]KAK5183213.1 hypothetical protein LTR44_004214 [Eurotiomycetes sp. CCFEE 6388]
MSQPKRIALAGGTGMLGAAVVQAILARKDLFYLTIITRSSSASKVPVSVRTIVVESYDNPENDQALIQALGGHDVLISTLNSAVAVELEPKLVGAAIRAGVKHFMPSEYTLDVTYPSARELGLGNFIGARAAWADRLAEIASTGQITYTTLVTGGFLDFGLSTGMLGFDSTNKAARLYDHGQNAVTACTVPFIAKAVVVALQMPVDQVENKRINVAEVEYTGKELLQICELVTGEHWHVEEVSTESARQKGKELLAEGNARGAYLNFATALNFDGCGAANLTSGLEFGSGYGLQRRSLEEIVREAVKPFQDSMK